jgi:hypothetical protein
VSPYATVSPASGAAQNFSGPVSYTVTAQDKTTAVYTVTVTVTPNHENAITGFTINGTPGTIDQATKTIAFTFPYGTDVSGLAPLITVSPDAAVSPASGAAQNFSGPVSYTVTAQDKTTAVYTVTVTVTPNHENAITGFSVNGTEGTIDEAAKTVVLNLPYGANVSSLAPVITVSPDATVSPASGAAQNFSGPVIYTVTAQNGDTQDYAVTVYVAGGADTGVVPPPAFPADIGITQSGNTLSASSGFTDYQWYVDDIPRAAGADGTTLTLTPAVYGAGKHRVRVIAYQAGVPYSAELLITL